MTAIMTKNPFLAEATMSEHLTLALSKGRIFEETLPLLKAAGIGVTGKDVLLEHGGEGLYQPIDLKIAKCRMSVAVQQGFDYASAVRQGARLRVATKYLNTAREHFAAKGVHVDLIKLYGSMELGPLVGLADAIVDLVSSGATLAANDLVGGETIIHIS